MVHNCCTIWTTFNLQQLTEITVTSGKLSTDLWNVPFCGSGLLRDFWRWRWPELAFQPNLAFEYRFQTRFEPPSNTSPQESAPKDTIVILHAVPPKHSQVHSTANKSLWIMADHSWIICLTSLGHHGELAVRFRSRTWYASSSLFTTVLCLHHTYIDWILFYRTCTMTSRVLYSWQKH